MSKGAGKQFEFEIKNFLKSMEDQRLLTFGKNEALGGRFKRIPRLHPDFYVFTFPYGQFFYLEAKSTQNKKSFPFKNIKSHQIRDLRRVDKAPNGHGWFVINFRAGWRVPRSQRWNDTFIIPVKRFLEYRETTGRSSMTKDYCEQFGIKVKMTKTERVSFKTGKTYHVDAWNLKSLLEEKWTRKKK